MAHSKEQQPTKRFQQRSANPNRSRRMPQGRGRALHLDQCQGPLPPTWRCLHDSSVPRAKKKMKRMKFSRELQKDGRINNLQEVLLTKHRIVWALRSKTCHVRVGSGVILVKRNARFCGMGSGLFGVGNSRLVFRLRFSLFFWTESILSLLGATPAALGSPSPGRAFFSAAIS